MLFEKELMMFGTSWKRLQSYEKEVRRNRKTGFFGHLWDYGVAHVGLMIEFASGG